MTGNRKARQTNPLSTGKANWNVSTARTLPTAARVALLLLYSAAVLSATDPWVRVVGNGFGDINNKGISAFHVFQGQLYAATNRRDNAPATFGEGQGPTQLWRSPDGQNWTRVTNFSSSLDDSNHGVFHMADSGPTTPQYFYFGTPGGGTRGPILYRSTDGTNWTQINGPATGFDPMGNDSLQSVAVKESQGRRYLYAGTHNDSGAQVWRIPYDATTGWQKVLDFATVDRTIDAVTFSYLWKDTLVVGTLSAVRSGGANLYSSSTGDPGTWVKNAGVGDGFGVPENVNVAAIIEFNGFLYVSTQNRRTGGHLWRSADGQTWTPVVRDGFGNPLNQELHRLAVGYGFLWVATFTAAPRAAQVWRSADGLTFVQSNVDGFSDPQSNYGYPPITAFKDWMFWGGQNKITGGQVWRVIPPPPPPPSAGPSVSPGGVMNNASYNLVTPAVPPGAIAAIFGSRLTDGTSCLPPSCNPTFGSNGRLNTTMAGAQVSVNGTPVPIFYAIPGQLGVQIPTELTGSSATIQVSVGGQSSPAVTVQVEPVSPGIFSFTGDGKGAGAFTHADGSPVLPQNPARPGEVVILYANGLGQVTPPVPTGALPTGASVAVNTTTVTIDNILVIPDFAGLAGCCVGLNQINLRIPSNTRTANDIPVVLSIGGKQSNTVTIAVQ